MKTFSSLRHIFHKISGHKNFLLALVAIGTTAGLVFAKPVEAENFIAHEWGTFTSLQASDGVLLNWQAVAPVELPGFVYNWTKPGLNRAAIPTFNKGIMALQRMETPVVYFYGDKAQKVDVTVRFPKGKITEWFPQAKDIGPSLSRSDTNAPLEWMFSTTGAIQSTNGTRESLIRWNFEILSRQDWQGVPPLEKSGNHYFAARETDAAILRVNPTEDGPLSTEHEKFLFYRGVGNFGTPLKVTMSESGEMTLANTGNEKLKHLFILNVKNGAGKFLYVKEISPGEQKTATLDSEKQTLPLAKLVPEISGKMVESLKREKLYPREAKAMVKTWVDSWFQEEGLRVLYVLPRTWTDEILPMKIVPQPRELVRVMVGRTELISPALEKQLIEQLVQAAQGNVESAANVKTILKKHGRFATPIFNRARSKADPKFANPILAKLLQNALAAN